MTTPSTRHVIWVGDQSRRPDNCIRTWIERNPRWKVRVWGNDDLANHGWFNARQMLGVLDTVRAKRFVLVSTFDVYPERLGVDEDSVFEPRGDSAFGEHRLEFETRIAARFPHCHIVRLPAVFGPGARRNVVHDLVNRVELESINPQSRFQRYPVERLAGDIDTVMAMSLLRVDLATEPIATSDLHSAFFGDLVIGGRAAPAGRFDVHSRHGRAFGGEDRYMMAAAAVRASMGRWIAGVGRHA